jgi:hypothetical protein
VRCMHASRLFLFHRAYLASRTRPRSPRSEPRFLALGFRAAPLGHPPARPLAVPRSWDLLSRRVVRRDSKRCRPELPGRSDAMVRAPRWLRCVGGRPPPVGCACGPSRRRHLFRLARAST